MDLMLVKCGPTLIKRAAWDPTKEGYLEHPIVRHRAPGATCPKSGPQAINGSGSGGKFCYKSSIQTQNSKSERNTSRYGSVVLI